jgi:CRP-like cAMP-binding protein
VIILCTQDHVKVQTYGDESYVMRQGDSGSEMYILVKGSLTVLKSEEGTNDENFISMLERGAVFGEVAVVYSTKRSASVVALDGPVKVIAFPSDQVHNITEKLEGFLNETREKFDKLLETLPMIKCAYMFLLTVNLKLYYNIFFFAGRVHLMRDSR